jgi:hypothetical protein
VTEKKRIETLGWWSELAGQTGIAANGVAWHFQVCALVGQFKLKGEVIDVQKFIDLYSEDHRNFRAGTLPLD